MKRRCLPSIAVVLLAVGVDVRAQHISEPAEAFGLADPRPATAKWAVGRPLPSRELGLELAPPPELRLEGLDVASLLAEDAARASTVGTKTRRIGVVRPLHLRAADGHWYRQGPEALWVVDIRSPDAVGIRVHLRDVRLPAGSTLAISAPSGSPEPGAVDFYDAGAVEREIWSSIFPGDRLRLEYRMRSRRFPAEPPFVADQVGHLYADPMIEPQGAAGDCHNDVSCFSQWANVARAVARIVFASGGGMFVCTGQLLTTQTNDFTPYFLTANHCISTSSEAQSSQFFWRYQTPSCGASPPSLGSVPTSRRATLANTFASSDSTLLLIEGVLPAGLFWSGWTAANVANGEASTAIHHPSGDFKRISFGDRSSPRSCGGPSHVRVDWRDGPTEPGSSGSGIFRDDTKQLYGSLTCGPSACGNETNDDYGSFAAFHPRVSTLLRAGSDDNFENNDTCTGAHLLAPGAFNGRIVKLNDTDWHKVSVPVGRTLQVTIDFTQSNGEIEARLRRTCTAAPVQGTDGTNRETLTFRNTGAAARTVFFQVYLGNDTRNAYKLTVRIL